ncbi:signal peptidase I [Agromyces aurantiacus]|uniref:Signal peptidase I n=1 Tax=Agromyces aurantiacus TaxID=165814 RepID=A0ABV9R8S8_9MICO|nr:signal peptidase I [Agromyces aurantiacus]MBM7504544.1 signal peptidase I [Agromyces aurantiacus]
MPGLAGVIWIVVVIGAAVLVHRYVVFPTVVRSESMRPSLEPGDVLLAGRVRSRTRLRRGEILVYRDAQTSERRIRRMIGLPGDRVQIADDGVVSVNGDAVFEPYARRSGGFRGSFRVPADRFFVLSDQRGGPHDTRTWRESFVPVGEVVGVARVRLLPWPIVATGVLAR